MSALAAVGATVLAALFLACVLSAAAFAAQAIDKHFAARRAIRRRLREEDRR